MENKRYPNIVVVDDCEIERMAWERLARSHDVEISVHEKMGSAIMEWIELCGAGHKPRAIVCDWQLGCTSIASKEIELPDGRVYTVDGAGFLLHTCCEIDAEHEGCGMFVAYSNEPALACRCIAEWTADISERITLIDKSKMSCRNLLDFIITHKKYITQQ